MTVIPALRRWKQGTSKFKVNLGYIWSSKVNLVFIGSSKVNLGYIGSSKVNLGYIGSSKSAWVVEDPVSKKHKTQSWFVRNGIWAGLPTERNGFGENAMWLLHASPRQSPVLGIASLLEPRGCSRPSWQFIWCVWSQEWFFSKAEKECHAFVRQVINALSQGTRYQLGPIKTEFPSSGSRR